MATVQPTSAPATASDALVVLSEGVDVLTNGARVIASMIGGFRAPPGEWDRFMASELLSGVIPPASRYVVGSAQAAGGSAPYRVVALGDSLLAGAGVDDRHDSLPVRIAQAMHARVGRPIELTPAAVVGADIDNAMRQLGGVRDALDGADLVLVSVGANDAIEIFGTPRRDPQYVQNIGTVRAKLRRYLRAVRTAAPHARIVVLGVPDARQTTAYGETLRGVNARRIDATRAVQRDVSRELGVEYVDVPRIMRRSIDPSSVANGPDGVHPDARTQATVARIVAREIVRGMPAT